jgi:hypothetical protein
MPAFNGIGWFEIGTDDPAAAERFYGDVFGWTVAHEEGPAGDPDYQIITTGDPAGLHGGLAATQGEIPGYAVFGLLVADVEDTCRRVEAAGGKVARGPLVNAGGVAFAYLLDPAGNHFQVFKTPDA